MACQKGICEGMRCVSLESLRMVEARTGLTFPRARAEDAVAGRRILSRRCVRKRFRRPGYRAIAPLLFSPGADAVPAFAKGAGAGHGSAGARCMMYRDQQPRACWDVPQLSDRTGKCGCSLGDDLHVARRNHGDIVRGRTENSSRLPLADNGWPGRRYALAAGQEKYGQQ